MYVRQGVAGIVYACRREKGNVLPLYFSRPSRLRTKTGLLTHSPASDRTAQPGRMLKKSTSGILARHGRLTGSAAFTHVPRVVNLRGSPYCTGCDSPMGHEAVIDLRPSADGTFLLRRVADLAAALPDGLLPSCTGL
jgi:hypothetical protein